VVKDHLEIIQNAPAVETAGGQFRRQGVHRVERQNVGQNAVLNGDQCAAGRRRSSRRHGGIGKTIIIVKQVLHHTVGHKLDSAGDVSVWKIIGQLKIQHVAAGAADDCRDGIGALVAGRKVNFKIRVAGIDGFDVDRFTEGHFDLPAGQRAGQGLAAHGAFSFGADDDRSGLVLQGQRIGFRIMKFLRRTGFAELVRFARRRHIGEDAGHAGVVIRRVDKNGEAAFGAVPVADADQALNVRFRAHQPGEHGRRGQSVAGAHIFAPHQIDPIHIAVKSRLAAGAVVIVIGVADGRLDAVVAGAKAGVDLQRQLKAAHAQRTGVDQHDPRPDRCIIACVVLPQRVGFRRTAFANGNVKVGIPVAAGYARRAGDDAVAADRIGILPAESIGRVGFVVVAVKIQVHQKGYAGELIVQVVPAQGGPFDLDLDPFGVAALGRVCCLAVDNRRQLRI